MKKKALVVYYTQSGQLKNIVDSVCEPLRDDFVYEELRPIPNFPFPWKGLAIIRKYEFAGIIKPANP